MAAESSETFLQADNQGDQLTARQVAARIADARRRAGLTLAAVAERNGLSTAYLSQIESGAANPTVRTLAQVADALGVDVATFFGAKHATAAEGFAAYLSPAALAATVVGRSGVWDLTAAGDRRLVARLVHGDAADHAEPVVHAGEEFVVVLRGRCRLHVGADVHALTEGDSCHYSARVAHRITAGSPELTLCVVMSE